MRTSRIPQRDRGRQVGSGATSNWTATSPESAAVSSRIFASRDRSRSTLWRMTGSGFGDGWVCASESSSVETSTASRNRSYRSWAAIRSAVSRSAWRAFSSMLRRSARPSSASARRSRAPDRASRSCSSLARASSPLLDRHRRRGHGLLGDLEVARVLVALGRQAMKGALELLLRQARAAVGAADARLEPVAQGRLVAREVAQLVVAHRGRGPEERFGGDARQLGHDLVGECRVRDGRLAVVAEIDRRLSQ